MSAGGSEYCLVGRAAELSALEAQYAAASAGDPRVVLVEGAPGVGKTSLICQFLVAVPAPRLVRASGDEGEQRLAFGVVRQILQVAERVLGDVERLSPEPAENAHPLEVGAGLLQVLGALSAPQPAILVVDNTEWADAPSLKAITFALRRLHVDPLLTVLTITDNAPNVPAGLRRLADERGVTLRLEGLSTDELRSLLTRRLGQAPPQQVLQRWQDQTGGNPLHITTLLRQLDDGCLMSTDGVLPAPPPLRADVHVRLSALTHPARCLVQAAAVLGQRSSIGAAARVAGLAQPAVVLEEAIRAGLVQAMDSATGPVIAFSPPMVRSAVYHELGPALRSELHARAATVTEGVASLRHRSAATLAQDPDLAVEVALLARRELQEGAVVSGATWLITAARLTADPSQRGSFLLDAMEELLLAGEVAEAARLAGDVEQLPETPRRQYLLGRLAFSLGRRREAEDLLVRAWEGCTAPPAPDLGAQISLVLAQLCSLELRVSEAVVWSQRALRPGDDSLHAASVLGVLVPCLGAAGRPQESLALASSLPDGSARPLRDEHVEGVLGRGLVRMWTDDLFGARADLSAVVRATTGRRASSSSLIALAFLAEAEYRLGLWDDSVANGGLAASLTDDSSQTWLGAFTHAGASWVPGARGDWRAAESHVRAAWAVANQLGDPSSRTCAAMAAAHLAYSRADHTAVLEAVEPLLELSRRTPLREPSIHPWRELRAEALVQLGRLQEAEAATEELRCLAEECRRHSALASSARVRGTLEAARGHADEARCTFERALAHSAQVSAPYDRALIELAFGRFLRRLGERKAAAAHLRAASSVFWRLGAKPMVERSDPELRACGLSPRGRSGHEGPQPTPQETAVARLVVEGATNREVAAHLVVSVKTVEYHLGNLYAKLGIASRRELVERMRAAVPHADRDPR